MIDDAINDGLDIEFIDDGNDDDVISYEGQDNVYMMQNGSEKQSHDTTAHSNTGLNHSVNEQINECNNDHQDPENTSANENDMINENNQIIGGNTYEISRAIQSDRFITETSKLIINNYVQLRSLHDKTELDGYYPNGTSEDTKMDVQDYRYCISIAFPISGGIVSTTPHHVSYKFNTTFCCKLYESNQWPDNRNFTNFLRSIKLKVEREYGSMKKVTTRSGTYQVDPKTYHNRCDIPIAAYHELIPYKRDPRDKEYDEKYEPKWKARFMAIKEAREKKENNRKKKKSGKKGNRRKRK